MKYMRYISWFLFLHLIWWGFTGMPLWGIEVGQDRKILLWCIHAFVFISVAIGNMVANDGT